MSKDYEAILLEKKNGVATLTLNRPERLNALDNQMKLDIASAIEEVRLDEKVKVLILTGAGRAFCAGGDLRGLGQVDSSSTGRDRIKALQRWVVELINLEKPVIAAVNGIAVGAGCNLALAADIIIAADTAKFSEIFAKVGLIPDAGGLYFLPRLIGPAKAKELAFTGRMVDAAEAVSLGLINRAVAQDKLMEEANAMAVYLAKGPSKALGYIKVLINKSLSWDLTTLLEAEALAQGICMDTDDFKEGVQAFFDKREAKFLGK